MPRRRRGLVPAIFLAALLGYAAWPWLPFSRAEQAPPTIVFYGFSILADVFQDGIFPAFQKTWAAEGGGRVEFVSSFGGSGTVTNQVIMGVPAQVALLSLESDADRLVDAGVVSRGAWKSLPHEGVVNLTPFVILVRPGNPLGIAGFEDLTRTGVGVVHPDPMTSGGANWAILAEYGAGARGTPGGQSAGEALLSGVWKNVVAQAASARAARTQFENGFGDALITYEQDALWDRGRGRLRGDIVYPPRTILSEHTLVVIDRNVHAHERALVDRFVRFLWSEEAQRIFVRFGFRSVQPELDSANPAFGVIPDAFRISDFGGWRRARREIVDGIWKNRVMKEIAPR
ncbi:MAG TPA: substrate-binding domain-containing protein [Thermoanaerobaculia bacterium]|nr:substrate-binding domain-containing protein [Thermoanaerobaculia bacterium]